MKDYDCYVFVGPNKPPDWFKPNEELRGYNSKWVSTRGIIVYFGQVWRPWTISICGAKAEEEIKKILQIISSVDPNSLI